MDIDLVIRGGNLESISYAVPKLGYGTLCAEGSSPHGALAALGLAARKTAESMAVDLVTEYRKLNHSLLYRMTPGSGYYEFMYSVLGVRLACAQTNGTTQPWVAYGSFVISGAPHYVFDKVPVDSIQIAIPEVIES